MFYMFRFQINPYYKLTWKYRSRKSFARFSTWFFHCWRGNATHTVLYERNYCIRICGLELSERPKPSAQERNSV